MSKDEYNLTPPKTMEAQENKLIALAFQKAEQDFLSGKVTSQVHTHFLQLGAMKEKVAIRKMELETELLIKKIEAAAQSSAWLDLVEKAFEALTQYMVVPHERD